MEMVYMISMIPIDNRVDKWFRWFTDGLDPDNTKDDIDEDGLAWWSRYDIDGDGILDNGIDSDGDGINDLSDSTNNPTKIDTDSDGIIDEYDIDDDNDTLNDKYELSIGQIHYLVTVMGDGETR